MNQAIPKEISISHIDINLLKPAPENPRQAKASLCNLSHLTIISLTRIAFNGIINVCDKSISFANNAVRNSLARKHARIERLVFVLANAVERQRRILKTVYIAVSNSIITKINISVRWLVRESLNREKNFQELTGKHYLWPAKASSNLRNMLDGKVTMWDTAPYMNGFIKFWVLQWFVNIAERANLQINKFIGLIKAENISALKATGFAYALNVIKNTISKDWKAGRQKLNRFTLMYCQSIIKSNLAYAGLLFFYHTGKKAQCIN